MGRSHHNLAAQTCTRFTVHAHDRHTIAHIERGSSTGISRSTGNAFNLSDNSRIIIGDGHRGARRRAHFLEHQRVDAVGASVQQIDLEDGILARAGGSAVQQEPVGGVGHRVISVLTRVSAVVAAQVTDSFQKDGSRGHSSWLRVDWGGWSGGGHWAHRCCSRSGSAFFYRSRITRIDGAANI